MKILVSIIVLFSGLAEAGCRFRNSQKVFSLSGPMTSVIEEAGLLSANELRGISVFYPKVKAFKGKYIPGGIFLSPSQIREMKGALIFFDEGQELRKLFRSQGIEAIEVRSRGQTPREATEKMISALRPHTADCDFGKILQRLSEAESKIAERMKSKENMIFFLGKVNAGKLPELVIAHDGLVLWLKKKNLINTYPSELGYINWSGSIINNLDGKAIFIGITEEETPKVSGTKNRATLSFPGALIPGIRQLDAWNYFLDHRPR